MTLVKDISPTGIKAMRERISAEVKLARQLGWQGVRKKQWALEAYRAERYFAGDRWMDEAVCLLDKRDDHMDAARRCKWELEHVGD